jgi:cathepsin E
MYVFHVETLVKALIHVSSPITSTSPSNQFWGINQSVRYGTSTSILATTAGIIDTGKQKASQILQVDDSINTPGTTLLLLATDGFNKYKTATGAVLDSATGLLRITSAQFSALQSLFFIAGGVRGIFFSIFRTDSHGFQSIILFSYLQTTFELTANAQLWPRSLNTLIGGTSGSIYLIVNDLGTPSGQGLDIINGYVFLERFYVVINTAKKAVGLANTPFTHATTN